MKPFRIATVLAALGVVAAHYLVFVYVPMEKTMGAAQRIYYFHVPSAMLFYLGIACCFVGSLGYLLTRKARWDVFAHAAAEVALVFGVVVLVTGPLWAKAAWSVWWKWEPRLTTMAILFLIFCAYWALRSFGGRSDGVRTFAAVLAVLGTPNIYFVSEAVKRWGGVHPPAVETTVEMKMVKWTCLAILMLVFTLMLILRYRVRRESLAVLTLKRRFARLEA
ncbi:MAG: heme exporter protein C [Bradymonadia bacterium]|jgi:heme exporter protein C